MNSQYFIMSNIHISLLMSKPLSAIVRVLSHSMMTSQWQLQWIYNNRVVTMELSPVHMMWCLPDVFEN